MKFQIDTDRSRNLMQWFDGWLMERTSFESIAGRLVNIDIPKHLASNPAPISDGAYVTMEGSTAIVSIHGVMMKSRNSMMEGSSTVELRRELRALQDNGMVEKVVLHIESPGGTAAGTMELGQAVRDLAAVKPVMAFIEDIGASAAYWIASQADSIYANKLAKVGSIGTYAVVADMSKAAEQQGIKVHVVRAGEFKGMGTPGTEVTETQLAEIQRMVDGANGEFLSAVARGRGLSLEAVTELADGRVHLATDAVSLGLIDGVSTLEQVVQLKRNSFNRSQTMATAKEIQEACPGIKSEKVLEFLNSEKSLASCVSSHMQELALDIETLKEQLSVEAEQTEKALERVSELEAELASAKSVPGLEPLVESFAGVELRDESSREEWNRRIEEKVAKGLTSSRAAISVNQEYPDLRKRMLDEVNS